MPPSIQPPALAVVPLHEVEALLERLLSKYFSSVLELRHVTHPADTPKASFRTRKEAALTLGISLGTMNTRLHDGTIPCERIGRRVLIPEAFFTALEQRSLRAQSQERGQ